MRGWGGGGGRQSKLFPGRSQNLGNTRVLAPHSPGVTAGRICPGGALWPAGGTGGLGKQRPRMDLC